jgi:hypothetical protein
MKMMLKEKGYGAYGTTSTYVDINGNFIIDEWFDGCTDMDKNGIGAVILENNKRNFINREGKFLCREPFDERASFSEGYAGVYYTGKGWTFIDINGNFIDDGNMWFQEIGSFNSGYAPVMINRREWFYIDPSGHRLNDDTYEDAKSFNSYGLAEVENGNYSYNLLKPDGEYFLNMWVDEITDISQDGVYVRQDYENLLYKFDGSVILLDDDDEDEMYESIKPKKQLIRITEDEFYNIIKESVKNIITKMIL